MFLTLLIAFVTVMLIIIRVGMTCRFIGHSSLKMHSCNIID